MMCTGHTGETYFLCSTGAPRTDVWGLCRVRSKVVVQVVSKSAKARWRVPGVGGGQPRPLRYAGGAAGGSADTLTMCKDLTSSPHECWPAGAPPDVSTRPALQVTSNDVMAVWRVLGVEAARATLVREVRAVFGAYGIAVDPRHLGLIADYMMHQACLA